MIADGTDDSVSIEYEKVITGAEEGVGCERECRMGSRCVIHKMGVEKVAYDMETLERRRVCDVLDVACVLFLCGIRKGVISISKMTPPRVSEPEHGLYLALKEDVALWP